MISCITTILDGVSLAHLTWELVSVPVAWSKSRCSLPVQISEKSAAKWDSNADRIGKSEVQLVNIFIEGLAQIVRWEQKLEAGEDIENEVANAGLPAKY